MESDGETPNKFQASWGGNVVFDQVNIPYHAYQNYSFTVTAATTSTTVTFGFRNDLGDLNLDGVSVTPICGVATFTTTSTDGGDAHDQGQLQRRHELRDQQQQRAANGEHGERVHDRDILGQSVGVRSEHDLHGDGQRGESWSGHADRHGDVPGRRHVDRHRAVEHPQSRRGHSGRSGVRD